MKFRRAISVAALCLFLITTLSGSAWAWDSGMRMPEGSINSDDKIHYININTETTSDSFLIESNGRTMLVDTSNPDPSTGGNADVYNDTANVNEVIRYLQHLGISTLDYVVLTHNHSDHIGGVPRLCEAGLIGKGTTVYYRTDDPSFEETLYPEWDSATYIDAAMAALDASGADTVCLKDENITALTMELGDFSIEFLNLDADKDGQVDFSYENENNNSIVLKVTKGSVDTLLTGDLEAESEYALLPQLEPIEVLKVPHHGVRTSSSYEFMCATQPETAILTANGYWQYGALEYLLSNGAMVFATGDCPGLAIVEVVGDDCYEIQCAIPYFSLSSEGWHSWLNYGYYVSHGFPVRDKWKRIDHNWYYFNEDGIAATGTVTIDGESYSFTPDGILIPR